jgi:hypothetical protein
MTDRSVSGGGRDKPVAFPGAAFFALLPVSPEDAFRQRFPSGEERSTVIPVRRDGTSTPSAVE